MAHQPKAGPICQGTVSRPARSAAPACRPQVAGAAACPHSLLRLSLTMVLPAHSRHPPQRQGTPASPSWLGAHCPDTRPPAPSVPTHPGRRPELGRVTRTTPLPERHPARHTGPPPQEETHPTGACVFKVSLCLGCLCVPAPRRVRVRASVLHVRPREPVSLVRLCVSLCVCAACVSISVSLHMWLWGLCDYVCV